MMPLFGLQGALSFPAGSNYTPPKTNWASIESSSANDNAQSYALMDAQGNITLPMTAVYMIIFNISRNELSYTDTSTISVLYTPVSGSTPFILGTNSSGTFQHIMSFNAGDKLTPIYNFASACSASLPQASVANTFRITFMDPAKLYMYQASTSSLPLSNPAPRILCFSGVLTTGFQVVLPLTIDGTVTGPAIFQTITGMTSTAVASSTTTNVMNTLMTSIDPVSSNLKTVTVNVATGTTVTTLLVGSNYTLKAAPAGTIVYLNVFGW